MLFCGDICVQLEYLRVGIKAYFNPLTSNSGTRGGRADPGVCKRGPKSEGVARIEDANHPRIEGEAQTEEEAREKAGEEYGEEAR